MSNEKKVNDIVQVGIRMKKEMKESVEKRAEEMGLSINAYILIALNYFEKEYFKNEV